MGSKVLRAGTHLAKQVKAMTDVTREGVSAGVGVHLLEGKARPVRKAAMRYGTLIKLMGIRDKKVQKEPTSLSLSTIRFQSAQGSN